MAAMEIGGSSNHLAKQVEANLLAMRDAFIARCEQAVRDGELPAHTDCSAVASMLLAMTRGIIVLNRGVEDADLLNSAVAGMIASLD